MKVIKDVICAEQGSSLREWGAYASGTRYRRNTATLVREKITA